MKPKYCQFHQAKKPRGITLVMALVLISLFGATLSISAVLLSQQAKRTRDAVRGAQQRQLFLVGTQVVAERLALDPLGANEPFTITLPPELKEASLICIPQPQEHGIQRVFVIRATIQGKIAEEILRFSPLTSPAGSATAVAVTKWQLDSAELGRR